MTNEELIARVNDPRVSIDELHRELADALIAAQSELAENLRVMNDLRRQRDERENRWPNGIFDPASEERARLIERNPERLVVKRYMGGWKEVSE